MKFNHYHLYANIYNSKQHNSHLIVFNVGNKSKSSVFRKRSRRVCTWKKMAGIRSISSLILLVVCVQCSGATKLQPNFIDFEQIRDDLYSIRDLNISNVISEIASPKKWRKNPECLLELTAIKHGFEEFEEWAVKSEKFIGGSSFSFFFNVTEKK